MPWWSQLTIKNHQSTPGLSWLSSSEGRNQPADDERLLSINPDSHDISVLLVVVVAGCAYAGPDESHVGQEWPEAQTERGTCKKNAFLHKFTHKRTDSIQMRWAHLEHVSSPCGSKQAAAGSSGWSGLWFLHRYQGSQTQWHSGRRRPAPALERPDWQQPSPNHTSAPWEQREKLLEQARAFSFYAVWAGSGWCKSHNRPAKCKQHTCNLEGLPLLSALEYTQPQLVLAVGKFQGQVFVPGCVWQFGEEKHRSGSLWTP